MAPCCLYRVNLFEEERDHKIEGLDAQWDVTQFEDVQFNSVYDHILSVLDPETRTGAICFLSDSLAFPNLSMYLYHTHGVYDIIISEITKIYPALADGTLNLTLASNAHYALQLLEVIVTNRRLQEKFLEGNKPECVYQIFMREPTTKFEGLLRRDCLKVLDALALHTGLPVSKFFIDTKYLTLCVTLLKSKDLGEVETALRTLKTFLHSPVGPDHVNENELTLPWILEALSCATTTVLKKSEAGTISTIIMCYLKLAEDQRSILYLPQMVHEDIWNGKLDNIIECHLKQFRRYLLIKVGHADSL